MITIGDVEQTQWVPGVKFDFTHPLTGVAAGDLIIAFVYSQDGITSPTAVWQAAAGDEAMSLLYSIDMGFDDFIYVWGHAPTVTEDANVFLDWTNSFVGQSAAFVVKGVLDPGSVTATHYAWANGWASVAPVVSPPFAPGVVIWIGGAAQNQSPSVGTFGVEIVKQHHGGVPADNYPSIYAFMRYVTGANESMMPIITNRTQAARRDAVLLHLEPLVGFGAAGLAPTLTDLTSITGIS